MPIRISKLGEIGEGKATLIVKARIAF